MPRRSLHVLLPTGTKEEVREARRVLGGENVDLYAGTASAHTAGQTLYGDVVVVGGQRLEGVAERDATGKVTRFADMDALTASKKDARGGGAAMEPAVAVPAPGGSSVLQPTETELPAAAPPPEMPPEQPLHPNGPEPLPDLAVMDRAPLISLAAQRFPKRAPWATMRATDIRAKLVELTEQQAAKPG